MSFQPPYQGPPQAGQQQPEQPPQLSPAQQTEQEYNHLLEELLGGAAPGAGYLFATDPQQRQANMVKTTPEVARDALLRAVETMASDLALPYGMDKKAELGKAILECAQAFLLLDPTVDATGVPVGAEQTAKHETGMQMEEHKADLKAREAAHASGQAFERPETESGYKEPPRVKMNPAENAIAEKNKGKSEILKGARGDKPTPRPRVGS